MHVRRDKEEDGSLANRVNKTHFETFSPMFHEEGNYVKIHTVHYFKEESALFKEGLR